MALTMGALTSELPVIGVLNSDGSYPKIVSEALVAVTKTCRDG